MLSELREVLKTYVLRKRPAAAVANSCELYLPSRTVLGLTRYEIETLRSMCAWNFAMFTTSVCLLAALVVLFLLDRPPFSVIETRGPHFLLACLLGFHTCVSFLGFAATQREQPIAIDFYCVLNGIAIVCDTLILVYLLHYGEFNLADN